MSDRALSMLVYSESKVGKTTLAMTTPAPRLLLDVESASRFVKSKKVYWNPMDGSAPPKYDGTWETCVVNVHSFDVALKAFEWLKAGKHPFSSVLLDSISELQVKALEEISGRGKMQTQHWGELLNKVSFYGRDLRDLTTNPVKPIEAVVIIATNIVKDNKHQPYLQGQIASQVPFWYDVCGYYYLNQEQDAEGNMVQSRNLLIDKHPEYEAGNRVPGLPSVIANPNISELLDAIFGEKEV